MFPLIFKSNMLKINDSSAACAKVIYLWNCLLCICIAKKVIPLDRYTDTHYKMTIFYLCICFFLFIAQIEDQMFVSFWDTNKYTDAKKDAK